MNLKSYSRGIGAGIIVTAIIMGIASNKRTITDEEVINRAKELGYTQSSVLAQASVSDSKEDKVTDITDSATSISLISIEEIEEAANDKVDDPDTKDRTSEDESSAKTSVSLSDEKQLSDSSVSETSVSKTSSETSVSDTSVNSSESDEASVEDPKEDEANKPTNNEESVLITINRGDSSVTVSRRMYEAGLVESAVEFDQFLCTNGYDKYLAVGEYEIIFGLDFDTMARIITRSKMN